MGRRKMEIPKKVKIAGRLFRVLYPYEFKERADISGRCDFGRGTIMIAGVDNAGNKCPEDQVSNVFFHEIFHLIDRIYCCNNIGKEAEEEDLVDSLAFGIDQFLRDNFKPLQPIKK